MRRMLLFWAGASGAVWLLALGHARPPQGPISVGFMSSSDKRVHFGLGGDTAIGSLEIRWPSGIRQTVKGPAADRFLTVDEPGK